MHIQRDRLRDAEMEKVGNRLQREHLCYLIFVACVMPTACGICIQREKLRDAEREKKEQERERREEQKRKEAEGEAGDESEEEDENKKKRGFSLWRRRLLSAGGGKSWLSSTGSKNWYEDKWRKLPGVQTHLQAMLTVSERDEQRKKETMPRLRITHVLAIHAQSSSPLTASLM